MNAFTTPPKLTVKPQGRKYAPRRGLIAIERQPGAIHLITAAQGRADADRRDAIKRAIGMKAES